MADATLEQLGDARNVLVYVATWGEGDPPQRAIKFYDALMGDRAPQLPHLRFAVLALGDSAYINFCETGRLIDERLEALGATRSAERIELDLDFSKQAATWTDATLTGLAPVDAGEPDTVVHIDFSSTSLDDDDEPAFDADHPLTAEITEIVNLNGTGSTSETWHVELSTEVTGYAYQPGDAIGVVPQNDPELVARLAETAGLDADPDLTVKLTSHLDITTLTRPVIQGLR